MKIVYVAYSLLNRGGDRMVLAHAGWMAAHGHDVELCCSIVDTVLEIPAGIRMSAPRSNGMLGMIISALFSRRDADIVLASITPMACFLFPRSGRRVVYFAQDYNELFYSSSLLNRIVGLFNFMALTVCRIPVIAVSGHLAARLSERFGADVRVVENGVNTKQFFSSPDPALISVKGSAKAVLFFSRKDGGKAFDIAQKIARGLAGDSSCPVEVWTVGETCHGVFEGCLHRDFGYVEEGRLRQLMSSADVFVYPTRHEGFGLMPLEAFACGCPVVTTTAVAFARHRDNALVASVEDVSTLIDLTRLILSDDLLRSRIVSNAMATAQTMTLEASSERFASTLESYARAGCR